MKRVFLLLTLALFLAACAQAPQSTEVPPGGGLIIQTATPGIPDYFPATESPVGGQDPFPSMGTISGNLSYPADRMPALRITAYNTSDMSFAAYTDTGLDQSSYQFELPEGTYYIVAYVLPSESFPSGFAAGYTQAVLCGFGDTCSDHALVPVTVKVDEPLTGINPTDWSYDPNTYPPMPTP